MYDLSYVRVCVCVYAHVFNCTVCSLSVLFLQQSIIEALHLYRIMSSRCIYSYVVRVDLCNCNLGISCFNFIFRIRSFVIDRQHFISLNKINRQVSCFNVLSLVLGSKERVKT